MHAIMVEKWQISMFFFFGRVPGGGVCAALPIVRRCPMGYIKIICGVDIWCLLLLILGGIYAQGQ